MFFSLSFSSFLSIPFVRGIPYLFLCFIYIYSLVLRYMLHPMAWDIGSITFLTPLSFPERPKGQYMFFFFFIVEKAVSLLPIRLFQSVYFSISVCLSFHLSESTCLSFWPSVSLFVFYPVCFFVPALDSYRLCRKAN